jgi:hypothetical protein
VSNPNLAGRTARCAYGCGATAPSALTLPFFEFLGEGSREAALACKTCRFFEVAHEEPRHKDQAHPFEPHGAFEFDRYYCGCRGWD